MEIRLLLGRDFCVVMQFEHYKGTKGKYNLAKKNVRERLTEVFGRVFS